MPPPGRKTGSRNGCGGKEGAPALTAPAPRATLAPPFACRALGGTAAFCPCPARRPAPALHE